MNKRYLIIRLIFVVLAGSALLFTSPNASSAAQPVDVSRFELRSGENYFRVDGKLSFVLGRNPAGMDVKAYDDHFRNAAAAGERLVRIHFTYIPPGEKAGEINDGMLNAWDAILDAAEKHGLGVLPVLGVWADWNDGSNKESWHRWDTNPFNVKLGGPAKKPDELFDDTLCRKLWLKRLETFVKRWSHRRAIIGWEIFSELDLVTGATEDRAIDFAEHAAAVIRAADPKKRLITASQAGINEWPKLLRSGALDFIQIHPYADAAYFGGRLDDLIISTTRERLRKYGKPVFIGECGLDSRPPRDTLDAAPNAETGIRHAIWASVVSGAMNGRMLWWQDGNDQFENVDLCSRYNQITVPMAAFIQGVDFTGFKPIEGVLSGGIKGAMVGNDKLLLGWFRDEHCEPPDWPMMTVSGQSVSVDLPGSLWQVEFFDTLTGKSTVRNRLVVRNRQVRIPLPEFQGSVAFKMKRVK